MTVINIAVMFAVLYLPLNFLLPSESNAASDSAVSIDGLFKFMTVFGVAITVYVSGYTAYFAFVFAAGPANRSTRSAFRSTMRRNWNSGGRCCRRSCSSC